MNFVLMFFYGFGHPGRRKTAPIAREGAKFINFREHLTTKWGRIFSLPDIVELTVRYLGNAENLSDSAIFGG